MYSDESLGTGLALEPLMAEIDSRALTGCHFVLVSSNVHNIKKQNKPRKNYEVIKERILLLTCEADCAQ